MISIYQTIRIQVCSTEYIFKNDFQVWYNYIKKYIFILIRR